MGLTFTASMNSASERRVCYVATRTFTYINEFGRRAEVVAGRTLLHSTDCEDYRRFPDAFKPAAARPSALRRTTDSPAAHHATSSGSELRTALSKLEPPKQVRITSTVRRSLREAASHGSSDGLECGGFLFGRIKPDIFGMRTQVDILEFSRPCLDDKRAIGSLQFSSDRLEEAFGGRLSRLQMIGDWHTHVGGREDRNLVFSDIDAGAWGARSDRVSWQRGRPPGYVGLILAGDASSSYAMRMGAWFVQPMRWDLAAAEREPRGIAIEEVSELW